MNLLAKPKGARRCAFVEHKEVLRKKAPPVKVTPSTTFSWS